MAKSDDAALSSWREGLSKPRQVGLLAPGLASTCASTFVDAVARAATPNLPIGRPDSGFALASRSVALDEKE